MANQFSEVMRDFTGGLDFQSSYMDIPPACTPDAINCTINEYGGLEKVLGYRAFATLDADVQLVAEYRKSGARRRIIAATATKWAELNSLAGETVVQAGLTARERPSCVEYGGSMWVCDEANALAEWDGTTYTPVVTTGPTIPKGQILGIFNDQMVMADASLDATLTVRWSDPADFSLWPEANYVNLNGSGSGSRIMGAVVTVGGIVVFSDQSTFLVFNLASGGNVCLDADRGIVAQNACCLLDGAAYGLARDGVFRCSGQSTPQLVSGLISPLFHGRIADLSAGTMVATGRKVLAGVNLGAEGYVDRTLEVYPDLKHAIMATEYPLGPACTSDVIAADKPTLFFVDSSQPTKIRRGFIGGSFLDESDERTDITFRYETSQIPMGNYTNAAMEKRLQRVHINGVGDMNVHGRFNGDEYPGTDLVQIDHRLDYDWGYWDTDLWDQFLWFGYAIQDMYGYITGRGKTFSLIFEETSQNVGEPRGVLGNRPLTDEIGGAAIYTIQARFKTTKREF